MTRTYTASDFANARFAEHPDGRTAMKSSGHTRWDVKFLDGHISNRDDYHLASFGWVPVPTKPTITQSLFDDIAESLMNGNLALEDFMDELGIEVTPDPKPTNTELIADALIDGFEKDEFTLTSPFNDIAAALATRGITAPKEDK